MILKKIFSKSDASKDTPESLEKSLSVLISEVIRVDYDIAKIDLEVANKILIETYGLKASQATRLISEALEIQNRPTSYHPFVKTINEKLSYDEKVAVIEGLWKIAVADKRVDKYEDHIIRKFSELLHIQHVDLVERKNLTLRKAGICNE